MARSVSSSVSPVKRKRKSKQIIDPPAALDNDGALTIRDEQETGDLVNSAEEPWAEGSGFANGQLDQNSSKDSSDNENTHESDSDEAPEAISISAGKRQIKQREEEIDKFTKATARARRQANRVRDEKLKKNSRTRKTKIKTAEAEVDSEESSSSDEETEDGPKSKKPETAPVPVNTKKYLDPSLFASASQILEKSKEASQARASEKTRLLNTRQKKQKKLQDQDWKDLGNNTTVVLLSQTEHLNPAPRPVAAANFARNRLYTKPSRSAVRLPKATLAAKAEMGSRKSAIETTHSRRSLKPALVFARSQD
ncbi:hypothetical protein MJO28_002600 [Puccinia striiformis f. sp. tritici]|uniref:Uncharacterized protein n=2 Tax=Puccinia striiformis TaxID=27350 RepID=A0A2S4UER7_9BASI|nr:hypothetical protein Pst134EB_006521 [Puccinia striiformis f. sp. tritici]KAI7958809.1 hypothetical protein MJO28_002600 [Puccinia striiformis f. sp. tritici]POV95815.1 hypothetical protein PSTT_16008 [Puccinia striiformis]